MAYIIIFKGIRNTQCGNMYYINPIRNAVYLDFKKSDFNACLSL